MSKSARYSDIFCGNWLGLLFLLPLECLLRREAFGIQQNMIMHYRILSFGQLGGRPNLPDTVHLVYEKVQPRCVMVKNPQQQRLLSGEKLCSIWRCLIRQPHSEVVNNIVDVESTCNIS